MRERGEGRGQKSLFCQFLFFGVALIAGGEGLCVDEESLF